MNNKGVAAGAVLVVILFLVGGFVFGTYNELVDANEKVEASRHDIDTQLQRRADLIPNLVNTVKGYMDHEQDVIDKITSARENLVTADSLEEQNKANRELNEAINKLYVIVEAYPDLKASENFIGLQDELAGSENRVSVARKEYNKEVKSYNSSIKKFPAKIIASMFNFEEAEYFAADDGVKDVPQVSFD